MKFFIKTYGCQMNVNDSEKMRHVLQSQGWEWTESEDEADIIVINSCAVRKKPQEKIYSYMGRFGPEKKIILAGCVAQVEGESLFQRRRKPDYLVGTHQFYKMGEIAQQITSQATPGKALAFTREWQELIPAEHSRTSPVTAYIPIMEGCDNFCSYCIVPFSRGREKHRPFRDILGEAASLSRIGYREIILLGQNVNAWEDSKEKLTFPRLLERLAREVDVRWIRFITSYPGYHDPELPEIIAENRRLARHIHFPAQSGSTRILRKMNRSYTRSAYLSIIRDFRCRIPEMAFSSDFIVGFPGETDREFRSTLSLLKKVDFTSIYSFIYSPRPRTRAEMMPDDIPLPEKKMRLKLLQEVQEEIQLHSNRMLLGQTLEVLITERNPKKPKEAIGRTEAYRVVNFPSQRPLGQFVFVRITAAGPHSLRGEEAADPQ